jgi:hypothetical protein
MIVYQLARFAAGIGSVKCLLAARTHALKHTKGQQPRLCMR